MALGPMSPPRRPCPRSMGTPKIPTGGRALSGKGDTPRAPRVGGRLEGPVRGEPDGVDPAEKHVRLLEGEHPAVAPDIGHPGPVLVSEQVPLRVESRRKDSLLDAHTEVEHVYKRLKDGGRYARGAGRSERNEPALGRGDDRRAHAGDQT